MVEQDLDQNTIDSLFSEPEDKSKVVRVNFAERRSLTAEQMKTLIGLNQTFTSSVSSQLSSNLDTDIKLTMISAERVLCRDQLKSNDPESMYLTEGIFDLAGSPALLQIDLSCVGPVVHLSLGGSARLPNMASRELTLIDNEIMDSFMEAIWIRLNDMWSPFSMRARFHKRVLPTDILKVFPHSEYLLSFMYGISVGGAEGFVILSLSTSVADLLLKALERRIPKRAQSPVVRRGLEQSMEQVTQRAALNTAPFRLSIGELSQLQPGDLVMTGVPASKPLVFCMGNGPVWLADAVVQNERIGSRLTQLKDLNA